MSAVFPKQVETVFVALSDHFHHQAFRDGYAWGKTEKPLIVPWAHSREQWLFERGWLFARYLKANHIRRDPLTNNRNNLRWRMVDFWREAFTSGAVI